MVHRRMQKQEEIAHLTDDLATLPDLPSKTLKERWTEHYGAPPPTRLGRALMIRAIAYRLQENVHGGMKPVTRRGLTRAVEAITAGRAPTPPRARIKPGTRLLREWQGVTHEVIVLETGVQYRGKSWASMSAVAREITGTRWSGPLFFGLRTRNDA